MKTLELFSGCGGLAKGLENAGFDHCAFVEFNKDACNSLRLNFKPSIVHETDVRLFDFNAVRPVDLIAGGPPCQPFSLGGLGKAYDDKRDMFPEAARAIGDLSPKGFIFENVKGLLRTGFADYFDYIKLRLTYPLERKESDEPWSDHFKRLQKLVFSSYSGLKYHVYHRLLNAADYGVPQTRERVFVIGIRADLETVWSWPVPTTPKTKWQTVKSAIKHLPDPAEKPFDDHFFVGGAKIYPGHTGSDILKPSKTIKAGAHGVPGGENMLRYPNGSVRYMTIREAKLIQTFPESYKISGPWGEAMRQIGNAVPVKLAEIIGRRMHETLAAAGPKPIKVYRIDDSNNYLLFEKSIRKRRQACK